MGIEVKRDSNLGMPKAFARDLRVNAARQQMRSVGVASVMKSDAWKLCSGNCEHPRAGQATGLDRLTVLSRVDEGVIGLPYAEPEEFFSLLQTMRSKLFGNDRR